MSEVTHRLATDKTLGDKLDAVAGAITNLPNATQAAADNANAAAGEARAAVSSLGGLVADTYSSQKRYYPGDYVYQDSKLYRCIASPENAQWDPSKWELVHLGDDLKDISDSTSDVMPVVEWRNGSVFNQGNSEAIAFKEILNVENANKVLVNASLGLPKTDENGNQYKYYGFQFSTFDIYGVTSIGLGQTAHVKRKEVYVLSEDGVLDIDLYDDEKGFSLAIYADDGPNPDDESDKVYPLRVETVDLSKIKIYTTSASFDNFITRNSSLTPINDVVRLVEWRNGSVFNQGNTNAIAFKEILNVENANKIFVNASFDIDTNNGYKYGFEFSTFDTYGVSSIGLAQTGHVKRKQIYELREDGVLDIDLYDDEKGFSLTIYADKGSDVFSPLRVETVDLSKIKIYTTSASFDNFITRNNSLTPLIDVMPVVEWRNGSVFNQGNSEAIAFKEILNVENANKVLVNASLGLPKTDENGNQYKYYGFQFSTFDIYGVTSIGLGQTAHVKRKEVYVLSEDGVLDIDLYDDEKGFSLAIYADDGPNPDDESDKVYPLRVETVDLSKIKIFTGSAKFDEFIKQDSYLAPSGDIIPSIKWRNGSVFNQGNVHAIAFKEILDAENTNRVVVTASFDIKANEGYKYGFEFSTFDIYGVSSIGLAQTAHVKRKEVYELRKDGVLDVTLKDGEKGFSLAIYADDGSNTFDDLRVAAVDLSKIKVYTTSGSLNNFIVPDMRQINSIMPYLVFRNGSEFNPSSEYAITTRDIIPVTCATEMFVTIDLPPITEHEYGIQFSTFDVDDGDVFSNLDHVLRKNVYEICKDGLIRIRFEENEKGVALSLWSDDLNGSYGELSVDTVDTNNIKCYKYYIEEEKRFTYNAVKDTATKLDNARHIVRTNSTETLPDPLTILHFSDIHGDAEALTRILDQAKVYGGNIDDMICTGDMRANSYGEIKYWWNSAVMTVIGNHDTASYDQSASPGNQYNWTALSIADRVNYYIAPFESSWGLTNRPAGKTYYYKDYPSASVRMIVLDTMLYMETSSEADAQNTWLGTALDSANTNGYHVLIACHAPFAGSKTVKCSFSSNDINEMPTLSDCRMPASVAELVSGKIQNGLKFIGYIMGHYHQDMIFDVLNDKTQLAYCVTCAAVKQKAQWDGSDQHRSEFEDAYNLVTIDTKHGLIKIIRGGGANIDLYMRSRKAICINYLTGEIVGESL